MVISPILFRGLRNIASHQLALQAQMDIPDIEVCKLNSESLSLGENLEQ